MKQKTFLILAFSFFYNTLFAQNKCTKALQDLITIIEINYPGFEQKTSDKIGYEHFKADLLERSLKADDKECFTLLEKYTSYFRDGHIFFLGASNYLKTSKAGAVKKLKISKDLLKKINLSKDTLEGIWKNEVFRVGIVKDAKGYRGVILSSKDAGWKPGTILFNLEADRIARYVGADLTVFNDSYELKNPSTLFFTKLRTYFIKDNSNTQSDGEIRNRINELLGFSVKKLAGNTVVVKLKSFDYPFVARIKNLVEDHKALIENAENLIVDLRDNGGGTTTAITPLLPYVMTGKIRNMNAEYWISDFFIAGLENYLKGLANEEKNKDQIQQITNRLNFYRQNKGKFVLEPGTKPVEIETFTAVTKSPKQVVILINKKVGSAAESFVLMAKQSKKVKLIGTPTQGLLDYANAYLSGYEYNGSPLVLPTYRSLRLPDFPIDNIGVQPDIYLDKSVKDWVDYAVDYLEN